MERNNVMHIKTERKLPFPPFLWLAGSMELIPRGDFGSESPFNISTRDFYSSVVKHK